MQRQCHEAGHNWSSEHAHIQPGFHGYVHCDDTSRRSGSLPEQRAFHDALLLARPKITEPEIHCACEGRRRLEHASHRGAEQQHRPSRLLHTLRRAERHSFHGKMGQAKQIETMNHSPF